MAYSQIQSSQVDADSPIDTTLMTRVKDNFDSHEGRIANIEAGGVPVANGAVTNAKLNGGSFSFHLPETQFPSTSWTDIGQFAIFIPGGVNKISVQFRVKGAETNQQIFMRLRIGSNYGVDSYVIAQGPGIWQILNCSMTPTTEQKNTYGVVTVQAKNPNTGYDMRCHHDLNSNDGSVDYSAACTFIDV